MKDIIQRIRRCSVLCTMIILFSLQSLQVYAREGDEKPEILAEAVMGSELAEGDRIVIVNELEETAISMTANNTSGLIIEGKNHSEFANKSQAVSGGDAYNYVWNVIGHKSFNNLPTTGVHYKNDQNSSSGVTINNYYDINHPFVSTFDIPNPTESSSIGFGGSINASSLNVWNESGSPDRMLRHLHPWQGRSAAQNFRALRDPGK